MGETFVRSMMGQQVNSNFASTPAYGFGSGTREHREKTFVSPEHSKLSIKSFSPGPAGYGAKSTIGPQVNGAIESQPQWVFGSGDRFDFKKKFAAVGPGSYESRSSLGPQITGQDSSPTYSMGTSTRDKVHKVYISEEHSNSALAGSTTKTVPYYDTGTAVGKQNSSLKANQPQWVFGSNGRFKDPDLLRSAKIPAPDAYGAPSGLGPQVEGTKRSAPLAGFGTSTRQHAEKIFTSPQQEKTKSYGKASPGPSSYLPPMVKKAPPSFGFGTCDRWHTRKMALRLGDTPSPAHYNV